MSDSIAHHLDGARKELLDLGLRNPLINYRRLKARGVQVVDELPEEVYRILVADGKVTSLRTACHGEKHDSEPDERRAEPDKLRLERGCSNDTGTRGACMPPTSTPLAKSPALDIPSMTRSHYSL